MTIQGHSIKEVTAALKIGKRVPTTDRSPLTLLRPLLTPRNSGNRYQQQQWQRAFRESHCLAWLMKRSQTDSVCDQGTSGPEWKGYVTTLSAAFQRARLELWSSDKNRETLLAGHAALSAVHLLHTVVGLLIIVREVTPKAASACNGIMQKVNNTQTAPTLTHRNNYTLLFFIGSNLPSFPLLNKDPRVPAIQQPYSAGQDPSTMFRYLRQQVANQASLLLRPPEWSSLMSIGTGNRAITLLADAEM
ncbi:hypothetical protein ACRRTK_000346 [Alexandromys fortis]